MLLGFLLAAILGFLLAGPWMAAIIVLVGLVAGVVRRVSRATSSLIGAAQPRLEDVNERMAAWQPKRIRQARHVKR